MVADLHGLIGGYKAAILFAAGQRQVMHASAAQPQFGPSNPAHALNRRRAELEEVLHSLVLQYGYLAIFVVIGLESAGLPVPGEAALIAASAYAGATGQLHIALVIACAALGAIIGDNIGFWAGRRFGKILLVKYGPLIHV